MDDMNKSMWYDVSKTLSHNCLFNFVLSMRGGGKTFNCLLQAVRNWKKRKEQFCYVRRTETEIDECKEYIMKAISKEGYFPEFKFETIGNEILCNGEVMGFCIAVSTAYKLKSTAFPRVSFIIYDEFLIEDSKTQRYLNNEPKKLLSLYETVIRLRDKPIVLLGNYTSRSNPYFEYFNIFPKYNAEFTKDEENTLLIHMYDNKEFKEEKAKTKFAKLISKTSYGAYILDNKALNDNYTFVEKPTGNLSYRYTIRFQGKNIGIWYSSVGLLYATSNIDKKCKRIYVFDNESHEPNFILIKANKNQPHIKHLRECYENGLLRFENLGIKNTITDVFSYN